MAQQQTLKILKSALLLEIRGNAFYAKAAQSAQHDAVKDFFKMMADEEKQHIDMLTAQYKAVQENGAFMPPDVDNLPPDVTDAVLTADLKDRIHAAGFEAAAISAAMGMEKEAVRLYSKRAQEADDPQERALYEWLSQWERNHLAFLSKMDRDLTESIWNDNSFWPF